KKRDLSAIHDLIDQHDPEVAFIWPLYKITSRAIRSDEDASPVLRPLDSIPARGIALGLGAPAGAPGQAGRHVRPRDGAARRGCPGRAAGPAGREAVPDGSVGPSSVSASPSNSPPSRSRPTPTTSRTGKSTSRGGEATETRAAHGRARSTPTITGAGDLNPTAQPCTTPTRDPRRRHEHVY